MPPTLHYRSAHTPPRRATRSAARSGDIVCTYLLRVRKTVYVHVIVARFIVMPRGYNNDRIAKNFPHPHALHKDLTQSQPYTKELMRTLAAQRAAELRISNEMRPVIDFTRSVASVLLFNFYSCVYALVCCQWSVNNWRPLKYHTPHLLQAASLP